MIKIFLSFKMKKKNQDTMSKLFHKIEDTANNYANQTNSELETCQNG